MIRIRKFTNDKETLFMYSSLFKIILLLSNFTWFSGLSYASTEQVPVLGKTITQAKQQNMTPKQALLRLKEGNQRFLTNKPQQRDYLAQAKQSSYGQFPFAVVLNCMDSRSVPEFIFDQGLADLFTLRVAGNVLNDDILGSMEFATQAVGARLIVVLAHTSCGAVAGACEGVKLGHLTDVLNKIEPLVEPAKVASGSKSCSDPVLIDAIAKDNALHVIKEMRMRSPILDALVKNKQVGIIAGIHNIKTGEVHFFEKESSVPE